MRPMAARLAHFEEALEHLHALLHARWAKRETPPSAARACLNRMRSIADSRGALPDTFQPPHGEVAFTDHK